MMLLMQNDFYQNMPGAPLYFGNIELPNQETATPENEYMQTILKKTERIKVKVYMTFPDSEQWRDRIFDGVLEASGRDYIIVNEVQTGNWILLPLIYMDYIEFEESLEKYF